MINKIRTIIDESNSIVLLTHEEPDGDAIGSVIAFYRILKQLNKSVDIITDNFSPRFNILEDIDKIVDTSSKSYDLGIILDCSTRKRIYDNNNVFSRCNKTITIDHHETNSLFSDINYVEGKISSTTQILFYLFKEWKCNIDLECAKALMLGLLTDTNGFKNNNVDSKSYLMAAQIYEMGVDIYSLRKDILTTVNKSQHELIKRTLNRMEFYLDGKIAFSFILKSDFDETDATYGDHEGLVELGRDIDGVEVSIFMREENGFRISLRSNGDIDVASIALKLGGGGHKMAAGIYIKDNFTNTKNLIIDAVKKGF